ncbi:MAG: tachylectin-related carbohydrate-binding protein [Myxococcaceae bacterium]
MRHSERSSKLAVLLTALMLVAVGPQAFAQGITSERHVLYGVKPNGDLHFYEDETTIDYNRPTCRPPNYLDAGCLVWGGVWAPRIWHEVAGPSVVGTGWNSVVDIIPAGAQWLYTLTPTGDLNWYRHWGASNGTFSWSGPVTVGTGWNYFKKIVAGSDGVLYGIDPSGNLWWYRHLDYKNPATPPRWEGSRVVGTGWGSFHHVFGGVGGVVYAVAQDGTLYWYRHNGYLNGAPQWEGPRKIGVGWAGFKHLFSTGLGHIYAVKHTGEVLWYLHQGVEDGSPKWIKDQGLKIAEGWSDYTRVFALMEITHYP